MQPLPFVCLRSELVCPSKNKFLCITSQVCVSLIIFGCSPSLFWGFSTCFSFSDCDFPCSLKDKISRSTMRHAIFVLHLLVNLPRHMPEWIIISLASRTGWAVLFFNMAKISRFEPARCRDPYGINRDLG